MPQLQMPIGIWLDATPDERDTFFLGAGFDPALPTIDDGTDSTTVRFRQDPVSLAPAPVQVTPVPSPVAPVENPRLPQAGDDLRDFQGTPVSITTDEFGVAAVPGDALGGAIVVTTSSLATRLPGPLRTQFVTWLRTSGAVVGSSLPWNRLPSWLRSALAIVGVSAASIAVDDLFEEGVILGPSLPPAISPGASPLAQVQVVGSWVANGVTFYRLADGKLAVQNKKGRWKVWKPKRPIVLYSDGASNLKTMLRADKALNKQARKIATMLNRRAPRRKSAPRSDTTPIILGNNARVVDV